MMRKARISLIFLLSLVTTQVFGQAPPPLNVPMQQKGGSGNPTSTLLDRQLYIDYTNKVLWFGYSGTNYQFSFGTGSVTSVGLTMPSIFTVSGSPITSAGTIAVTAIAQNANTFYRGPVSGGAATPTFGGLVTADFPLTGVTAGSYTNANLTVDATGRITSASNGSSTAPPAGSDTQVQVNFAGVFGANSGFTYDYSNERVKIGDRSYSGTAAPLVVTSTSAGSANPGLVVYGNNTVSFQVDDGSGLITHTLIAGTNIIFPGDNFFDYAIKGNTSGASIWLGGPSGYTARFVDGSTPQIIGRGTIQALSTFKGPANGSGVSSTTTTITTDGGIVTATTGLSFADSEVPSGTINGTNTAFTTAHTPVSGSVKVYLGTSPNLFRIDPATYSVSGTTITFTTAPASGTKLIVDYRY